MRGKKFIQANKKIKEAQNILMVTHERPDGDALSSTCALLEYANILHKPCFAYCYDSPAPQFNFLPRIEKISSDKNNLNFKII